MRTFPALKEDDENNYFDSTLKDIFEDSTLLRTSPALNEDDENYYLDSVLKENFEDT